MDEDTIENGTYNNQLGQNVHDIRTSIGLTQEQFAEKLNKNSQFISQVETAKVGISIDTAIDICKVANCSSVKLFNGIIESPDIIEKYELLNDRDKSVITQMITYLLNTK